MNLWSRLTHRSGAEATVHPQTDDEGLRVEGIRRLIASGGGIDNLDATGMTALHWAANRGHVQAATLLIEAGADINARGPHGETPLVMAHSFRWSAKENPALVRLLVEHGADVGLADADGWFPLYAAAASGFRASAEALIELGADVNQVTTFGQTPLDRAKREKYDEVALLLMAHGGRTGS